MIRLRWYALTLALAALVAAGRPAPEALEDRIASSFLRGDFARAVELIEVYLERSPRDPGMLYNAACAYSRLGDRDRAASALWRAVQAGLADRGQIQGDPDLEAIRDHPLYLAVLRRLERTVSRDAQMALEGWRAVYGNDHYRYETDESRRIAYATALDARSHLQMRRMLERERDHLTATLFDQPASSFLLIAVPTPQDAERLFGADHIGGIYEHRRRQLVSD